MSRCVVCSQPLLRSNGRGRPRIVCERTACVDEQIYRRNNGYRTTEDLLIRAEMARLRIAKAQRQLARTLVVLEQRGVTA